jgi:hypothetical protein
MLFEEALDKAYTKTPAQLRPQGDKNIPKILAFLWTMIAIADGNFEDVAYIRDQNIISIPLEKLNKKLDGEEKSGKELDADQTPPENKNKNSASKKNKRIGAEVKTGNGATEPTPAA